MSDRPTPSTAPLAGVRVLVTRAAEQAGELCEALRGLGATPVVIPLIRLLPPEDPRPLEAAIARLAEFDWLVVTSPNGARFLGDRLAAQAWPASLQVAAVGPATAKALETHGIHVSLLPERADGLGVAEALCAGCALARRRILLARGDLADAALPDALRAAGAIVEDVIAYRNAPDPDGIAALEQALTDASLEWVTVASGSALRNLIAALGGVGGLARLKIASIGPRTSEAVRAAGLDVAAEAEQPTPEALAMAIARASGRLR